MQKKQIVFIEGDTTAFTFKLAKVLKKKGYETILITIMGGVDIRYNKQAFDKIITLNSKFIKANLKNVPRILFYSILKSKDIFKVLNFIHKLKPYVVVGRATPNWTCVIFKYIFRKYPFIYFPYDIRSFCFKDLEQTKKEGVPRFELTAEAYCFKNADGVMHKGDDTELEHLNKEVLGDVKITSPVIHFPPYCSKEFIVPVNKNKLSKRDKEIHLVFVGHLVTDAESEDVSWEKSIKEILNQKIHLHIYGKSGNMTNEELKEKFLKSYLYQFLENKYFHLHPPLGPKELIKEISKYDYGIWMGYGYEKGNNIYFASGNKMASYFEAGIPFIYHKNHKFIDKLMKKYGIRLAVSPDEIKNLKKILSRIDYSSYVEKVKKARKDFEIENNLPKFERFIEQVHDLKIISK